MDRYTKLNKYYCSQPGNRHIVVEVCHCGEPEDHRHDPRKGRRNLKWSRTPMEPDVGDQAQMHDQDSIERQTSAPKHLGACGHPNIRSGGAWSLWLWVDYSKILVAAHEWESDQGRVKHQKDKKRGVENSFDLEKKRNIFQSVQTQTCRE